MSTKHYDAAHDEFAKVLDHWIVRNGPAGRSGAGAVAAVGEACVTLIAKRDERIEALERRLAALEGDAK